MLPGVGVAVGFKVAVGVNREVGVTVVETGVVGVGVVTAVTAKVNLQELSTAFGFDSGAVGATGFWPIW